MEKDTESGQLIIPSSRQVSNDFLQFEKDTHHDVSAHKLEKDASFSSVNTATSLSSTQSDDILDKNKSKSFFSFIPSFFSNDEKKKVKRKKRKKSRPIDQLHDSHFHLDVNTALQSVEEHIIARSTTPPKMSSQNSDEFTNDYRHDSFAHHATNEQPSSIVRHEKPYILPPEFEMVRPLQEIGVRSQRYSSSMIVGSPPADSHSIPLIASGGMASLSLQSSYGCSPAGNLLTSPRKIIREKRKTDSSIGQTVTGKLKRPSLPLLVSGSVNDKKDSEESCQNKAAALSGNFSSGLHRALTEGKSSNEFALGRESDEIHSQAHTHESLKLHIPPPPVSSEVLKSVEYPQSKRPHLTNEEFKQKNLIRKMVYELELNWRDEDIPVIKRLSWYLLKDIKHIEIGESLWTGGEEAMAMGLLISGRLEAVTATPSHFGSSSVSSTRTLQIIMPGTLIGIVA